ncbi:hypothetical protein P0Y31_05390 [Knoellia sp. 3-2P3]|uniref:hypothetical protein n=1 Tax=unclassified Knoellia TaxID=2618719 RepID=UPI0023D9C191|nr:hypothetical protein [Knoellia sp. 3-2P3]MDF2091767.1 hypothetical protein [Knoellia sp. 3-2P3]
MTADERQRVAEGGVVMAFEYVRGYVQLASGLGELTKARATEAAQGLLSLPGAGEVGRRAMQVTEFADQLLEAARANRESLLALIRSEVESALGRSDVVRLADFDRARTALAALTREVDDLRASLMAEASRSPLGRALPGAPSRATVPSAVQPATESVAAAATTSAPTTRETTRPGAKKTAARKSTAKKTSAKKASAQRTAAKTAGTQTAKKAAKKATAKKATAKKGTAKKASAKSTATKAASPTPTPSTSDSTTSNGNSPA